MLTSISYNTDHQRMQKGLGVVEQASLVHYRSPTYNTALDWNGVELDLQKQTDLPIIRLKEGEFIVLQES